MTTAELLEKIKSDHKLRAQLSVLLAQPQQFNDQNDYCLQCGVNQADWLGICTPCLETGETTH